MLDEPVDVPADPLGVLGAVKLPAPVPPVSVPGVADPLPAPAPVPVPVPLVDAGGVAGAVGVVF